MTAYVLESAWVDGALRDRVAVEVVDGHFAVVGGPVAPDAVALHGMVLPGFANGHSHVFHRALRGRTQQGRGSFWTWREQMYAAAERLDPDRLHALARATYTEMLCAGYVAVGEFHYLHHGSGGRRHADPNETGRALIAAAREVGLRITLLDTCYLAAGIGEEPAGVQLRFSDGDADRWAERVTALVPSEGVVIGAAIHSVRAVPRDQIATVVAGAAGRPLHAHVSEQVAENEAALAVHGISPTRILHEAGALGPMSTAVHATHLSGDDIDLLASTGGTACFCPTTERDLGDGIGPGQALRDAGVPLTIGSDSQAVIDPLEEVRCLELHERLASQSRGVWSDAELMEVGTVNGHRSLGFPDAGSIAVGNRADLVVVDPSSVRTAGTGPAVASAIFAGTAADVVAVMVDGHLRDVAALRERCAADLDASIGALWA